MIHELDALRDGFEIEADAVVIGTGAGGAIAAANLAEAGMKVVCLEAGPRVRPEDMTRDAPKFLAKYFWDGGLRLLEGTAPIPSMQGRCLGGSTVSNSAIMLKLPDYVRQEWIDDDGLTHLRDEAFDRAFERVFLETKTAPTPMDVQGPRNLIIRDALEAMGIDSYPLPRAVDGCKGAADCIVGCASGAKQSVDRSVLPRALEHGAEVYTCAHVDRITMDGDRATGVTGRVVDPDGRRDVATFTVRAPHVVVAAGAMGTPVILQMSRINPGRQVGNNLEAHVAGGVVGVTHEPLHPWIGASQGWGAIDPNTPGLKYESLWADPSVMLVKWGGVGRPFMRRLRDIDHATVGAVVYRGKTWGSVRPRRDGSPKMKLYIKRSDAHVVLKAMKLMSDGLLRCGARYVFPGLMPGVVEEMTSERDTAAMLSPRLHAGHLPMTGNHVFCSCRMTGDPRTGAVDLDGRVRGTKGLWVCDASLFPSPSAVNPQATVMAMSDLISRGIGGLAA